MSLGLRTRAGGAHHRTMPLLFRLLCCILLLVLPVGAAPVINEVQSTNSSLPDPFGQLIDWVEIHNPTGAPINLQGYYLSDSTTNRLKFQFGDVTLSAGGYLLVWCGQSAEFPVTGPYPAGQVRAVGFAISSGGEPIVLTAPDGTTVIDEFPALVIGAGRSIGRGLGGQFNSLFFYDVPTPNAANTTTGTPTETLAPPAFSVPGGMYTSNVTLALSAASEGAVIRYTTDGSDPTESSPVYTSPLTLTEGGNPNTGYSWIPTNRQNLSYDESWQPPEGEVNRINVIRARVFKPGLAPSRIATHSYLVDPDGASSYPFPVISINTDPAGLFSNETGIYVHGNNDFPNYAQSGSAWERPGQIEFFETDGTLAFRGDMGVRLHGNNSVSRPRKSLRIYSRDTTGAPFNHRIFPQKEINQFSTFLLRNSGNDWGQAMLRDAFITSLAAHTGIDHQSARPAVVFLDGEYWGLHNLRDRIDEGYYLQHHGLGEMQFTQLDVHWQPVRPHWPVYDRGNPDPAMLQDFEDILNRADNNEYASEASFATIADRIDIDNYIDYNSFQIFAGNGDWPGNNTRLWRAVSPDRSPGARPTHDGRWRWILFDTDFGLGLNFDYVPGWNVDVTQHAQVNTLAYATAETQTSFADAPEGTLLLRKLTANPVFRAKFINRFADLLNTSLSPARTTNALAETESLYGPGIAEHKSRWRQPYDWSEDIDRIRTFLQVRPAAVRGHIAGKFGLPGTADLTVNVADANQGSVTVNTISIDPSTVGVSDNPYPWTGTYFQGVPVTVTAVPKPGYRFVSWTDSAADSGDGVVSVNPDPPVAGQTVTVRYNPAGRPLQNAGQVYLHYAINSWDNRVVPRPAMSNVNGQWQYTFTLPGNAEVLRMVFTATPEGNDNGPWDSNGGADWNIAVTTGVQTLASDSTLSYSGWSDGSQGGTGFEPWLLADTELTSDGFFIGSSGRAIHGASPDGRSFGIFAHSGGSASATRVFSGGVLTNDQTFSVLVSPGGFSGSKGVLFGQDGTNRFGFIANNFNGNPRYRFVNGTNTTRLETNFFPADVNSTFAVEFTPLGGNQHRLSVTRGSTTFTTNFTATGVVDRAYFFNQNAESSNDTNNLYFNNLSITAPGSGSGPGAVELTNPTVEVSLTGARTLTATFEIEPAVALAVSPSAWTLGFDNQPVTVRAVNSQGDTDATFTGTVTLTINGPGGVVGIYAAEAVDGVATFAVGDLPAGSYTLSAESGELSTAGGSGFTVRSSATFLPAGSGVWLSAANWDSGAVPNSTAVSVTIPPNTAANRDVTNNAPTTVASVTFDLGASAFRNRITGTTAQPLTLASTSGISTVTVTGTGAGHANIEVPGGVVFSNQVVFDVQNIGSTNAEYGALRLQGTISGPGAIVKRGPGMAGITGAGKTFSGDITIEQGVLTFSEPAITANGVTNYTVQPGGQLRLSSAGNPRNYLFKGPLNLAGGGRSGVPENENLGVLGALRLETGGTGTVAVLTNNVHLTDSADIHVPAANVIRLDGPLTAATDTNLLTKSGGGTLTLASGAETFTGAIAVNRGTLQLEGASLTNTTRALILTNETTLTGTGRWGGALQASSGAALSFSLGASPGGSAALRVGSAAIAGSNSVVLETLPETAPGSYPLMTVDGSFTGTNNLHLAQAPENYPTASLSISNGTLFAVLPAASAATGLTIEVAAEGGDGLTLPDVTVRAVNADNLVDTAFTGTITLTITGPDSYEQTYEATATAGAAIFTGLTVPAGGIYSLGATSGALAASGDTTFEAVPPPPEPPQVNPAALPTAPLVAGGASSQAALTSIFTDSDSPVLSYSASSAAPSIASVSTDGGQLTVTPLAPGEAIITVGANDGTHPTVDASFTVLVYPAAHALGSAAFTFGEWSATSPAMTFPSNMIFLQSEVNDPGLSAALPRAYQIPLADAAFAIDAERPYNATSRTRINGLGNDGIAFINTGRGRDVGAALLALDTTGLSAAEVSFTAGTVLANTRVYAIRLQYRIGVSGDFTDVTDGQGNPIEYLRNATNGHSTDFGSIALPEGALDQPYVQLLWRYYFVSGASGARAQLRLDDIAVVGTGTPDPDPRDRDRWNTFYGLTGEDALDEADPDGDGIANIFERAMFLDPTKPDSGLPVALGEPGANSISFTYRVAKGQSDITLSVLATYTLGDPESWTVLEPVWMDDSDPDFTLYRVELPTSESAGFLRLRATR
jgi:autotransporter-associated beta strand protein